MSNWRTWISSIKTRPYSALGLLILLALPITLLLVFRSQDQRSSAASPDKLETEQGVISGAVTKLSDSGASGGKFVKFGSSSSPGPTSPPSQEKVGPRPDPPFPTGSNVVVVDSSVSTNDNDAGPELQAFIDRQPDGTTIIFDKTRGGSGITYTMYNGLKISNREGIALWGYNTKLKVTSEEGNNRGSAINVREGSENIDILGFEIEGPNNPSDLRNLYNYLPGEWSHGVRIMVARNVRVEDNVIHNINGDGIYITGASNNGPDGGKNWNTIGPFYFQYNWIYQINRQGITNNDGVGQYIRYNIIEDIGMYTIDAEDGSSIDPPRQIDQVYITDNLLRRWSWFDVYVARAITNSFSIGEHPTVNYYEISRNVIEEGPMNPRNGDPCNWIISFKGNHVVTRTMVVIDNEFKLVPKSSTECSRSNPNHGAINMNNAKNLTIKNNDFQGMRILHQGTTNADISGNGTSPITTSYYDPY